MLELDRIDRSILRILQKQGRISYAELARQIGLSTTPCMERVKKLEREGVIRGYTAIIDANYLKASLVVFINIRVSGSFDYLLKARVQDMPAYRKFYGETLLTLPGVVECTSYVVMEEVKETMEVPTG